MIYFNTKSCNDYRKFLKLKSVPAYSWSGLRAIVPDEYLRIVEGVDAKPKAQVEYEPSDFCFDYQRDISAMAIRKKKFAVFADCGFGKTIIQFEVLRHAAQFGGKFLLVAPLMVVSQTVEECRKFYGNDIGLKAVTASSLQEWLNDPDDQCAITNFEAIRDEIDAKGKLSGIFIDESSMLKSHYGKWGTRLIEMGKGVEWKMCFTGTPAPNDRIEYANHAVFLDHFKTTNEFLAKYFINRGQTQNRWEIKPHALEKFYRDISHWCIFLSDPSTYGWADNTTSIPPIHTHIERIELSQEQRDAVQDLTGSLFVKDAGGIGQRAKLMQIAKGSYQKKPIKTLKPGRIREMVDSWPDESTIIWCHFNDEQDLMEQTFPEAASIHGQTKLEKRIDLINEFKRGERNVLISKPKVLGFGLNLQVATRQIFNGMNDSYEDFYQAVKRSNRIGSTKPLNVHIPVTEIEEPMIANVLRKAQRVESDTKEQEKIFAKHRI